ncbi:MAG: metallophosphoesterase [Leptotrichiaceae bacterium]|nr:metallophosphoesterase [Leptotrichiaceae bacterium]
MKIRKKLNFKRVKYIFLSGVIIGITMFLYAHYEYTDIKIETLEIVSEDIPEEFDGKKAVFIADFQLDTRTKFNKKQLEKIIKLVNEQEKDIIILGGDYTNWTGKIPLFYKEMEKLGKPEYGVYAVLGNHDYNSVRKNIESLKKLGYKILVNGNDKITVNNQSIYISGVDDLWKGMPDADKAFNGIKKGDFNIYITHNPDYFEEMTENQKKIADITLAGHTHGGQITFFGKIVLAPIKYKEKYGYGLKEYGGHKIYITSGLGGSAFGMFVRFFARPEIVVLKLKKK